MKTRRDSYSSPRRLSTLLGLVVLLCVLPACDAFSPRTPDDPSREAGTYSQPDTPNLVVINIVNAVAELNVQNYRRSLAEALVYRPAATAEAATSIFVGWDLEDEGRYFTTMSAASDQTAAHELRFLEQTMQPVDADRYQFDAEYVLSVYHNRPEVPFQVRGRLTWMLERNAAGLWHVAHWADQELNAATPTWSTLKAEFGR